MHEFIEALAGGFIILLLIFMGGYAAGDSGKTMIKNKTS